MATLLSLFALAVFLLGSIVNRHQGGGQHDVTLGGVVLAYFAGGIGGGFIVGLLRPLFRWRAGSIAAGILAATLFYGAIGVVVSGPISHWTSEEWIIAIILGVCLGTMAGNSSWEDYVYPKLPPPEPTDPYERRPLYRRWPR